MTATLTPTTTRAIPTAARWIEPGDRLLYGPGAKGSDGSYLPIARDDAAGVCTVTSRTGPDERGLIRLTFDGDGPHPLLWQTDVVWLVVKL